MVATTDSLPAPADVHSWDLADWSAHVLLPRALAGLASCGHARPDWQLLVQELPLLPPIVDYASAHLLYQAVIPSLFDDAGAAVNNQCDHMLSFVTMAIVTQDGHSRREKLSQAAMLLCKLRAPANDRDGVVIALFSASHWSASLADTYAAADAILTRQPA